MVPAPNFETSLPFWQNFMHCNRQPKMENL
jgi:hypothetical protein